MSFTASNAVDQIILDAAKFSDRQVSMVRKDTPPSGCESLGEALRPAR